MDVAELKNFTKVATKNYTAQSNVSYAIRSLEKAVGRPLFNRKDNDITLSEYGELFLPYVKKAFEALDDGCKAVNEKLNPLSGEVKICFTSVFSKAFVPGMYKYVYDCFKRDGYDIKLRSVMAHVDEDQRRVEDVMLGGDCDIGFSSLKTRKGLVHTRVTTLDRVLLLPADHPLARERSLTLQQVKDEPFILLDGDKTDLNYYGRMFESCGISPNIVGNGYGLTYILLQVASGHCLSIVPEGTYDDFNVVAVPLDHPMTSRDVYIVVPERKLSRAASYTKKLIIQYFEKQASEN